MERLQLSLRPTDVIPVTSVKQFSEAVLAALLLLGLAVAHGDLHAASLDKQSLRFVTATAEHQIMVEVARTEQERSTGLMFRRSLPEDQGMIFLYPQDGPISMWMKNTYIPLDMFFVRADGVIHRIEQHTEPFSERTISSEGTVRAVVEMIAGSANRLGIKPGDRVEFEGLAD
ncbi:MAG: DUF192 domain-containing protein [Rhodomicrobiaceae bacterium]